MTEPLCQAPKENDLLEDEGYWDVLLPSIEEGRVIPIVGPELLQVQVEGRTVLLDQYLAEQLAGRLAKSPGLSKEMLLAQPTLNGVVCRFLDSKGRDSRFSLYPLIRDILLKARLAPPKPLLELARIRHFNLFVSTTFDTLLEDAINQVRFGGKRETQAIAYSHKKPRDLDCPCEQLRRPVVFQLLGAVSTTDDYVICEEDLLEFIHCLQSETEDRSPPLLFDALKESHLLILGENFADWLARFFLRTAKRARLSQPRAVLEILADSRTRDDVNLESFLKHFSTRTHVFGGGAIPFISRLWQHWQERNPDLVRGLDEPPIIPPEKAMRPGSVFISYAHEDRSAVQELKAGLDKEGLSVWFDDSALKSGDAFNYEIAANIDKCACFVAVLSKNTEKKEEGYFRLEWDLAIKRRMKIAHTRPFILPVIIDDIEPKNLKTVRPELQDQLTITPLPGGKVTAAFVERVKETVERSKAS